MAASANGEPIAIVGLACRFPGSIDSPRTLWQALASGKNWIEEVPLDRWDAEAFWAEDPHEPGKTTSRWGGFLRDVAAFDAAFFGIAPKEAMQMDPQQRLALETAWEALEDAGIVPESIAGSRAGVFFGAWTQDYAGIAAGDYRAIRQHSVVGWNTSVIPARIAYKLDLHGPVMTVNTAQSSSLVAVHLGVESLRRGESDLVLIGGVNLVLTPDVTIQMTKFGAMSPTGQCRAFDAAANGYVRGEGCGVVVLRRLADAQAHGDRVYAQIVGSSVNSSGASDGLAVPRSAAQQQLLRDTWRAANVPPSAVSYVEAHGTGTPVGDPIEAHALCEVFGDGRRAPLLVGSVKTNFGHLEAASGIAGLLKTALALHHGQLPESLHFSVPNPAIRHDRMQVVTQLQCWPDVETRFAGVSSFGYAGTNAHVALQEAPGRRSVLLAPASHDRRRDVTSTEPAGSPPLLVSGRDEASLRAQARRWSEWLQAHPEAAWPEVVRTAALHRTHFQWRAALAVADAAQASEALTALGQGRRPAGVAMGPTRSGTLAMLFSGQGSQRVGMGRALHGRRGFERFTEALDGALAACDAHLDRPLREVMWPSEMGEAGEAMLQQTRYAQPALFALELALCRQWQGWGVEPQILVGHSVGELVCAHVAEVLSLEDAALLVCARGRLMQELASSGGGMASIEASEDEIKTALAERGERLGGCIDIAGINTATQVVMSGDAEALEGWMGHFEAQGRKTTRLRVSHAFHSAHMDAMLAAFEQVAQRVAYQAPKRTVISNLTGGVAQGERGELVSAAYWVKHVRHAVRFADGVHSAVRAGARSFLEVGPQAVLSAMAAACVAEGVDGSLSERVVTVASMRKGQPEAQTLMAALGAVHVGGHRVDWETILEGTGGGRVDLPTYAFQRQRYWLDASASTTVPAARLHAEDPADLATAAASKPEDPSSLRRRLAELPETDRLASLTSLVQEVVAAVLGLAGAAAIPDQRPIKELGMDSLMGVQVRNELSARANVNLPLTLVYNHPTPLAIAKLLLEKLTLARAHTPTWSDSEVRARLSQVSIAALRQQGLLDVLMALPTMPRPTTEEDEELMGAYTAIHDINGDSLLNFAERVLGGSHGK